MTSFHHYLPIDNALFDDGFYVTGAGQTKVHPGESYPPKAHPTFYQFNWAEGRILPEFAIILITEGNGIFESRGAGRQVVEPGNVVMLFPGVWHRYRPDKNIGWTEKWIQFSGEFAHKLWVRQIISDQQPLLKLPRTREFSRAMEELLIEIERRPGINSLRYALKVFGILDLLVDLKLGPAKPQQALSRQDEQSVFVSAARNYIWTNSQRALRVTDIAEHLGVSRRTLERKFRATQDRTIAEEIALCRFNRAERLLRVTQLPVKMVVHLSGFGRAENMRQEFIKKEGMSPQKYRAKVLAHKSV